MTELPQRFYDKIVPASGDCWRWTAAKDMFGYGRFNLDGKNRHAYRVAYEALVGPLPEGLELDHLCRIPSCVNPDHLEPVTHKENVRRGNGPAAINAKKTHCKHGHKFTAENTYRYPKESRKQSRNCKICRRNSGRQLRARRKALH